MKAGIIFLISVINTIIYFGNDSCCEKYCCEECYCEKCWKKNEGEKNKNEEEENEEDNNKNEGKEKSKKNEDEKKNEEVVENLFLEVEEKSEKEAEIFVSGDWLEEKKKKNSNPVLKLFKKIGGGSIENNINGIEVVKYKDGKIKVENPEKLKEILKLDTKKWALFEIKYKSGEEKEETAYLYCSDIESVSVYGIFEYKEFLSISVLGCDTSNVTGMQSMFNNCSSLTTLNISNFDTSNVLRMECMFYCCSRLTELNISKFNTSKVTNKVNMFGYCNKLQQITVRKKDKDKFLKEVKEIWKEYFCETDNDNGTWTFTITI